ncbi:ABC transporter substrate-binding protein [Alcaligenaceae bacterium 429]|nr:ABC transporter substrate-binding protein [Alcaligenaceae bacterium 429]
MRLLTQLYINILAISCLPLATTVYAQADQNQLRVQLNSDIRSTNPGVNRDDNTDGVLMHLTEGLVALKEDLEVGPLLAKDVSISDDGRQYTFTLRDNVHFHNGATLTADDVVWNFTRYLDPKTTWRCLSEFDGRGISKIESVTAVDALTVVVTLDQPSGLFLKTLSRPDCGGTAILHPDSVDSDGNWQTPIGTGPYQLDEWRKGQYIVLKKFANYQSLEGPRDGFTGGKHAQVDTLRYMIIPESSAAKAALYSGAIDIMPSASSADVPEFESRSDIQVKTAASMNLVGLLFQTQDPILRDPRIRHALALSLDIAELTEATTEGIAKANISIVPASSSYYGEQQAHIPAADLDKAKALLQEANYRGQPIKLIANKRYPSSFDSAIMVQAMAAQVGLNIELEILDWATQLDRYTSGNYSAMTFTYSARLDPSLNFEMISGDKSKQPRKVWDNAEARQLLQQSMISSDKAERQQLFDQLHALYMQDMPMLVFYNGTDVAALSPKVQGYSGWPADKPRFWNVYFGEPTSGATQE